MAWRVLASPQQDSVELTANLSTYLISGGKHTEANDVLTQHLAKYEDRYEIQYNLACSNLQTGNHVAAVQTLQHAIGM
jgi:hypothetical protein